VGTLNVIGNLIGAGGGVVAFEAESETLFAAMTVQPSAERKLAINRLVAALKSAGAWTKFDRLYIMAAHDKQAGSLDWKNPGTDSLVVTGDVRFNRDRGFWGLDLTGDVKNTVNFNALSTYAQNDAHFSVWQAHSVGYSGGADGYNLGTAVSPNAYSGYWGMSIGVNVLNSSQHDSVNALSLNDDFYFRGWAMASRTDAANHKAFLNGVLQGTAARASTGEPARKLECIYDNRNRTAAMTAGTNIEAEAPAVYTALRAYMESVGVLPTISTPTAWSLDFISNPTIASSEGVTLQSFFEPQTEYDWEGRPWYTEYHEVPFEGYRRVRNMFAAPTSTLVTQTVTVVAGREYRVSFTGTGTITISGAATATLVGQGASSRVASDVLTATTASLVCTVTGSVTLAQCEEVTHQSNQNPADYVSVGDLVYPYHGCGVDGIKHFITQNGNTVASELVTEAAGASLGAAIRGLSRWAYSKNECLQSENFGTTWAAVGTPTRSAAAKYCGPIALDLIGDDDGAALEGYTQTIAFVDQASATGASNYKAVSVFFSEGTSASTVIRLRDTTAGADRMLGAITWSGGVPTVTMTTGQLHETETLANGCFRACMQTTDLTVANTNQLQIYPATDAALAVGGTGNMYLGGVQAEEYPLATPYIPTTTAAATRYTSEYLGDSSFCGEDVEWINQTEGTFVAEASFDRAVGVANTAQQYLFTIKDVTAGSNERIMCLRYDNSDTVTFQCLVGGAQQSNLTDAAFPDGETHKVAYAYKLNDAASCVDGGAVSTDTAYSVPANLNTFSIGTSTLLSVAGVGQVQLSLRKISYFPTRLSNAQLQTESTL
jgi:hypothetical protein